ncbi:hypothetical protein RJT34_13745 [Clitoria ternatea]|uniref:Uncharacterized protein n=1 Tax=Clitoria ternatea TaxID=43366 RepID=A0AAN9JRP3_CLITE
MSLLAELFPASLKRLELWNYGKLEFPELNQNVLLTSLPLQIFLNLSHLNISDWENLECVSFELKSLPCHMNTLLPKLESLWITNRPGIKSFPEGGMPPSLRSLAIRNCEKLLRSPSLATMDMLTDLQITGPYDGVKSFPEEGLVLLPPSLTSLRFWQSESFETLDCNGLLHLTSLQQLTIESCRRLEKDIKMAIFVVYYAGSINFSDSGLKLPSLGKRLFYRQHTSWQDGASTELIIASSVVCFAVISFVVVLKLFLEKDLTSKGHVATEKALITALLIPFPMVENFNCSPKMKFL